MNLSGFSTEQQQYPGLHRLADSARQEGYRREERDYRRGLQQEQQKMRTGAFLEGFANPKDHLSGSPYDPEIVKGFNDMLQKGLQLAQGGADQNTILMALGPQAGQLTEYAQKAKVLAEQKKKSLELVRGVKGIDLQRFAQAFDDAAFYERDPQTGERTMRDLSQIDPNKLYADEILRTGEVYNNTGLQDWVKGAKQEKVVRDYTYYDKSGRMHRTKGEYSAPGFMVSDEDAKGAHLGFVPDYEVVTDEGNPVLHEFQTDKGAVKAPVRMVKESVFNALPPEGKAYLLQEARRYAREQGIPASAKQVEILARTMAYDEIKDSGKYGSTVSELSQTKPSVYETKNYWGIQSGDTSNNSGGEDARINDVFRTVAQKVQADKSKGFTYTRFNALSGLAQRTILKYVKDTTGEGSDLTNQSNLYITTDGSGRMVLRKKEDDAQPNIDKDPALFDLDYTDLNLPNQADVKGKRGVVAGGSSPQPAPAPAKRKPLSAFTKQ